MIEEALKAIRGSSLDSSVYVGCDSIRFKKHGRWHARYATVIVVHYASRHGASIFYEDTVLEDYGNLKMRLLNEVMFATNAALEIMDHLEGRHLEIHLDVNPDPKHKSNVALREAIGYVLGNTGITPHVKPQAWAASHASDHCVRGKLH
jgi:predicted RNase H-related nuclease YkuK (DUF458 family)